MGLGSAVALDLIITAGMCYYLRRNKSGLSTYVIDIIPVVRSIVSDDDRCSLA